MSICDGCGHDNIYGNRKERRETQHLVWICHTCRSRLLNLPVPEQESRRWILLPSVSIVSLAAVLMSLILAIGAHW